ncbi:sugar ABC transporter ATP-binding protein [Dialister succinatiphilus]|mgnify:CR=1 FL=1|jgi:ribose transport system ATP-binding protein|uniref:sugar ABC transporter ATP-binding protein n=2 Tax=Dialister succinatiphilus TaxID=487173 RepID=UPI0023561BC3|nr:sugar ABC transporter ATP-binding protein [Dialister succinatiphilus]MCI6030530.1 sugar ABC transporter ATP-binding protein [Dialister succinatiphilus]
MDINMIGICKSFGANKVLGGVNLHVRPGEVHALMGENGAGKSTLMNILTGIHRADAGTIMVDGKEVTFKNNKDAEEHGIAFIHQELNIWPNLSVLENLFLMNQPKTRFGTIDFKKMREMAEAKCQEIGIDLPLDEIAGECSVGQQQMTEITRSLMLDAKTVIMDEPTAALTERETDRLFEVMKKLKNKGVSIIYISHRMEEVFANCDTITVMRDGQTISSRPTEETNMDQIVGDMVGRVMSEYYPARTNVPGDEIFRVEGFTQPGVFRDISFNLRKGEILGVAGLMGAGRTEIMRAIFGVDPHESGKLYFEGKEIHIKNPRDAIRHGFGFITENRKTEGLILDFSIERNIALPSEERLAQSHVINDKKEFDFSSELSKRLGVKAQDINLPASTLSGGNQQKVVIAKWVGMHPKLLILDEPTRGIDIGAKKDIYDLMNELTAKGVSIIMVSSELPEVIGMSDRILVIHEGRAAGIVEHKDATQTRIMTLATGGE